MRLMDGVRRMMYRISYSIQKLQLMIMSLIMLGIVEYFTFYEVFATMLTFAPLAAVQLLPLLLVAILTVAAWRGLKRLRKKRGNDKTYSFL